MSNNSTNFPKPLSVQLPNVGLRTFQTVEELRSWASAEREFWGDISEKIGRELPFQQDFFLNKLISQAQAIDQACNPFLTPGTTEAKEKAFGKLQGLLRKYEAAPGLTREAQAARLIARLAEAHPVAAWLALAFEYDGKRDDSHYVLSEQIRAPIPLLKAIDLVRTESLDAQAKAAESNEALDEMRSRWERNFQGQIDLLQSRISRAARHAKIWRRIARNLSKGYKQLHKDHEARMQQMEKSFSTDMKLRAAERFWQAKRKTNRKRANAALFSVYSFAAIGFFLLCLIWSVIYGQIGMPQDINLTHALIYAVPTVIYIWFLRIFCNGA